MDNNTEINLSKIASFDKPYSKEEILNNLSRDDIDDFVKIFSIINIDLIDNQEELNILINNLTNHATPLREAVALKLEQLIIPDEFFNNNFAANQILKAIIDINPNVSRAICNIILNNDILKEILEEKIIEKVIELLLQIEKYNNTNDDFLNNSKRNTKSHAKNKKLFSLYWYLEGLSCCLSQKYNSKVLEIIEKTLNFYDYTIREKSAKILAMISNCPKFLLDKIKQDQNFYVKYQVYDKINNDN